MFCRATAHVQAQRQMTCPIDNPLVKLLQVRARIVALRDKGVFRELPDDYCDLFEKDLRRQVYVEFLNQMETYAHTPGAVAEMLNEPFDSRLEWK